MLKKIQHDSPFAEAQGGVQDELHNAARQKPHYT